MIRFGLIVASAACVVGGLALAQDAEPPEPPLEVSPALPEGAPTEDAVVEGEEADDAVADDAVTDDAVADDAVTDDAEAEDAVADAVEAEEAVADPVDDPAAESPDAVADDDAPPPDDAGQGDEDPRDDETESSPKKMPSLGDLKEAHEAPAAACPCPDEAELALLTALRQRRLALDERERFLREREDLLRLVEKDLDKRLDASSREVARLEERLGIADSAKSADRDRFQSVVEAFRNMSARKAAPLLANADRHLTVLILRALGPQQAGALLGRFEPAIAAQLIGVMVPVAMRGRISDADLSKAATTGGATP